MYIAIAVVCGMLLTVPLAFVWGEIKDIIVGPKPPRDPMRNPITPEEWEAEAEEAFKL
jgi:hypothetical protein